MPRRPDPNPRHNITERLWKAQHGLCFHCGELMFRTKPHIDLRWSREHLIPKSKGGTRINNIVLAHRICNLNRGTKSLSEEEMERALKIIDLALSYPPSP